MPLTKRQQILEETKTRTLEQAVAFLEGTSVQEGSLVEFPSYIQKEAQRLYHQRLTTRVRREKNIL